MFACYSTSTVQIYIVLSLPSEHFQTYHHLHGEVEGGSKHIPELEGVMAGRVPGEEHHAAAADGDGGAAAAR